MKETQGYVKRGKSFTNKQDVASCKTWLNINQDPIVGNLQITNTFWDRVLENYINQENDEGARSRGSLQSRWGTIMRSCNKFCGYLSQTENRQQSEVIEADKVIQAKMLYGEIEPTKFRYDHCWEILKYSVKWQALFIQEKQYKETSINNSPNPHSPSEIEESPISLSSDHDIPVEEDIDNINAKRPIGKKAEKESRKKKKLANASTIRFCDLFSEFNKQACEAEKRKAIAKESKLQFLEEANQRERKQVEVELKVMLEKNEREQKEKDDQIMLMDTSNMDPQTKAYYEQRKAEVFARLMHNSSSEDHVIRIS